MKELEYCLGITDIADGRAIISALSTAGFRCQGQDQDCSHLLRTLQRVQPQLVIMSLDLPGDVHGTVNTIDQEALAALLLVSRKTVPGIAWDNNRDETPLVMTLPVESNVLLAVVKVLYLEYVRRKRLLEELRSLRSKLQSRTVIERAKGILMKELSLDEQGAYRFLQKKSMDLRLPLRDYADGIITGRVLR